MIKRYFKIKLGGAYIYQKLNTVEGFIYVIKFLCSKQLKAFFTAVDQSILDL